MVLPRVSTIAKLGALAVGLCAPLVVARVLRPVPVVADLVYLSGGEPEALDPALATGVLEVRLLQALFEGLVRLDERTLAPRPAAASRWEMSADARRFRFFLRTGLRWSDGRPLTASDFVRSWQRAARPETRAPLRREAALVAAGASAPTPREVRIELSSPRPELPSLLTLPVFFPVLLERVRRFGERWTRPGHMVSNGPFVLERWDLGHRLVLARNPRFHQPAKLARIEAMTTSGADVGTDTGFLLYETGALDMTFGVPAGAEEALRGRPDLVAGPALTTVFLRFNVRRGALADARVRRALAQTIDRAAITRRITRGGERPTTSLVPPGLAGYAPARGWGFDPVAARAALEGWRTEGGVARAGTDGPRFHLLYAASDGTAAHAAEALQAGWRKRLGLELTLEPTERKVYFSRMRRLDYDICWGSWVADYPDPSNFLEIFRAESGNNRTGFGDERYEALLDQALAAPAAEERFALLQTAERRLLRLAPLAPLYNPPRAILRRARVHGISSNALNLVYWPAVSVGPEGAP